MYNSSSGWTLGCSKHVEDTIIKLKHWCKILCILLVHITLVYHTAMVKKRKGTERILTASWAVSHCRRAISWTSRYCPLGKMATLSWCQTELLQYLFCYQVDFIKNRKTERWKLWTEWIWILLLLLLSLLKLYLAELKGKVWKYTGCVKSMFCVNSYRVFSCHVPDEWSYASVLHTRDLHSFPLYLPQSI